MERISSIPPAGMKPFDLRYYRKLITKSFGFTTFFAGLLTFIIGYFDQTNYWGFSLVISLFSFIAVVFVYFDQLLLSILTEVLMLNGLLLFQTYMVKSAYVGTLIGLVLVIAGILLSTRILTGIFLGNVAVISIFIAIGRLSLSQTIDPVVGIAYVNNTSVLIPSLIVGYLSSLIISRVLIRVINEQQSQYLMLQDTQGKLIQQSKLESIQILAGGIAHDFNNLLTGILGNASLLKMEPELSPDVAMSLDEIEQAGIKARNLTRQLLTFSKGATYQQKKPIVLADVIINTTEFTLRGRRSKAKFSIDPALLGIIGDKDQIAQVIQNIVLNADQAMPNGGVIEVSADNALITEPTEKYPVPGKYVRISIRDHGKGISPENQKQIFHPFFTTKASGTGLGLIISQTIIQQHGGHIFFISNEKDGTVFTIVIPAIDFLPENLENKHESLPHYSGTVVILEDQDIVRNVVRGMLEKLGFTVIAEPHCDRFLEIVQDLINNQTPIFALILDLTIPGEVGGLEVGSQIHRTYPEIPMIISSGYFADNPAEMTAYEIFKGVLHKPYTIDELVTILKYITK
jgi:signal transduction histidine kinase